MAEHMVNGGGNGENGEHVFENLTDMLMAPVGMHGADVMVTRLEALGAQWRRTAVEILKATDPKGHATYREIKYAEGKASDPSLAQRREAYQWAATRVLEKHFAHPLCEAWRQTAAKVVEALDPAVYLVYSQAKHGAGEPTEAQKIEAYKGVVRRFLELAYTIPNL